MKHVLNSTSLRRAGAFAAALAAVLTATSGLTHASADTPIRLPGQTAVVNLKDGTTVRITRSHEHAVINPSLGSTPLHRNVWVSGRYDVGVSDKSASLSVTAGYIVACQLTLGGNASGSGSGTGSYTDATIVTTEASTGAGVTIGPGQAANYNITDTESADDFGGDSHSGSVSFTGGKGALAYTNETMMVNGCAGYAQARSWVQVKITTDHVTQYAYMYGKPFSMG